MAELKGQAVLNPTETLNYIEKIMDIKSKVTGHWQLLKVLGSGGFGQVTLWYNLHTGQKIAIKKLLENTSKDSAVKTKLTEKWCKEVEIMKNLSHMNIVATLEVPSELGIVEPLPILAMEYCNNGDLRQVLNKAENSCGLRESDIINILRDISNGLAYLHSCKIIHRDIKPDNIVLQETGSDIIYKLIDLGYAKALDQNSLSKSFVGTIQYIAPELFLGREYSSSVDYWSFGLMIHEIITGYRPFLPGFGPADWMKRIQNKTRSVICVVENCNGEILFNRKISMKNHSSRCFLEDIEKWLNLALDWNGHTRGRDVEKNQLVIFENLNEIISKKLINVFSLPTYETYSFEVKAETDISDLRYWLKKKTDLEKHDQLLLLPNGKCLSMTGNLLKNFEFEKLDRSNVSLFLYNSGPITIRSNEVKTPSFVNELLESLNHPLPYRQLKRCCADSIYFLQSQVNLYHNFLQGIKVKIANIKQKTLAIESLYEDLVNEWNRIENYGHFLSFSHKIDLENYIHYRKAGMLKSSYLIQKWIQKTIDVNNKITELKNSFNKTKQKQLVLLAKQRCRNLDDHSSSDVTQRTPLDNLVEKGQKLWDNLHELSKNDGVLSVLNSDISELINKTIEETEKFRNSQILKALFIKIWEADENLAKFLYHLTNIYKNSSVLKKVIENTQAERQKEVWSLTKNSNLYNGGLHKNISTENTSCYSRLQDIVDKNESTKCNYITAMAIPCDESKKFTSEKFKIMKINGDDLSFGANFVNAVPLQNINININKNEASSVIEDNKQLRYRIQEVQQTCNKIINEVSSLNWDFTLES